MIRNPDGTPYVEQIGLVDSNGNPVPREIAAMEDLAGQLGLDVVFTPYNV